MLWDLIRDYFVQYVFGGMDSIGNIHYASLPFAFNYGGEDIYVEGFSTSDLYYPIGFNTAMGEVYISLGDWLSTTATFVVLVIILVLCGLFIKKMVSTVANLMSR